MKKTNFHVMRIMKGVMLKYVPGMITCAEFETFIDDYLDQTLTEAQVLTFEKHLKLCRECREYLSAYQNTISLGKSVFSERKADEPIPDDVPEDLLQAMLDARRLKK